MGGLLRWSELRRPVLYVVCGGTGVALDLALFQVLVHFGVWYQAANLAGYASGTLASFALNRVITFNARDAVLRRMALFFGVAFVGYLSSTFVLWLLIERLSFAPFAAKLISLFVVLAVQYGLNSTITFRPNEAQSR